MSNRSNKTTNNNKKKKTNDVEQINNSTNIEIDINDFFKYFGEIFNDNNDEISNSLNKIINVRNECIMDIFEYQIKQQLIEITDNGILKKIDEQMDSTYDDTVKKMDSILNSIEKDSGFLNLSLEDLYKELENVPAQEDYDYFCNQMSYEKKLDKTNSSNKEKLFTIMYTIGNNCIEPNINLKKIILSIIKYEITRNELVEIIKQYNKDNNQLNTLDFITADMMFMSLGKFLSRQDMKIISRNIAYYFSKIC